MIKSQSLSEGNDNTKNQVFRDIIRILITGLFFVLVAGFIKSELINTHGTDLQSIRELLNRHALFSSPVLSAAIFISAGGVLISLGIPRIWISAISGAIFGTVWGILIGLIASVIGATALYHAGSFILGSVIKRRFGVRLNVWKQRFQDNAFWWILYGRLFPFSNATMASLFCGSCKVPFFPYLAASFLGFIPLAVVFTIFGSGSMNGNYTQIIIGIGLLLSILLIKHLIKKIYPDFKIGKTNIFSEQKY